MAFYPKLWKSNTPVFDIIIASKNTGMNGDVDLGSFMQRLDGSSEYE